MLALPIPSNTATTSSPLFAGSIPAQAPVVTTVPPGTDVPFRVAWRSQTGSNQVGEPSGCVPARATGAAPPIVTSQR